MPYESQKFRLEEALRVSLARPLRVRKAASESEGRAGRLAALAIAMPPPLRSAAGSSGSYAHTLWTRWVGIPQGTCYQHRKIGQQARDAEAVCCTHVPRGKVLRITLCSFPCTRSDVMRSAAETGDPDNPLFSPFFSLQIHPSLAFPPPFPCLPLVPSSSFLLLDHLPLRQLSKKLSPSLFLFLTSFSSFQHLHLKVHKLWGTERHT